MSEIELMSEQTFLKMMDRRTLLIEGACAVGALTLLLGSGTAAIGKAANWQEALNEVLKGVKPGEGGLTLTMPEIAENGNVVPITLNAEAAEDGAVHVKAMHVFTTDNPWPNVASFSFNKHSGKAEVTSRMRLARSQKVIAVAELSDGKFLMAETFVKVTIGGCGG